MEYPHGKAIHSQMISELKKVLVDCGVPEKAIATEVMLRFQRGDRRDADLLILGDDARTIVAQFEVKVGPDPYRMACRALRDSPKRHKCYAVAKIKDDISVSIVDGTGQPRWIKLSDTENLKKLLGDYYTESTHAINTMVGNQKKFAEDEWSCFRWVIGGVGLLLVGGAGTLEWFGHEFSWKIYFLLVVFIALFAAATGYVVHIKVGENEVSIEKQ